FATTEPHKVLQTVLDRCQRYEFRSITSLDTAGRLAQICEMEGITADPETLTLISSRAGGSMRDALSLLDQLRAFAGDTVQVGDLAQLLGRMPDDVLFEAVDLISERDIGAVFVFAERLIRSGVDIREFARALTDHLRSLFLVLHAPAAREILEVTDDGLTRLQEQANHLGSAEVLRLIDLTNEIGLQLRQAVEGRLALEVGLARMTRPDLHATPASLLARLDRLERAQGGAPSPSAHLAAIPPAAVRPAPAGATPPPAARPPARPEVSPPKPAAPAPAAPQPTRSSPAKPAAAAPAPEPEEGWSWAAEQPEPSPKAGPVPARAAASVPESPATVAPPAASPQPPASRSPASPAKSPPASERAAMGGADPAPAAEVAPEDLDLDTIVRAWPLIRDKVKRRKISFHAVLLPAEPVGWNNGELMLEFGPRSRFHRDKVADRTQNTPLLEAFAEVLGVTPRLNCVIGQEPPAAKPAADPAGSPPDDAGPPDLEGTDPPEDAIELIRRAFKGTVVVEDP
ncbi:MAG TPA: hypothetical protein VHL54_01790, partial [Actinomycetota bacterium]|nr:hypothetical protein [Actinomycetota bacterium]